MNTEEIIEGYLGNTEVNSIYQGSKLVWPEYFVNKYMIGGGFTTYNGTNKNKIIRLNDDYSIDNTWYNNNSYNTSGDFYQLIYNNRKIYATGDFWLDGGLVRLNMDGTKDTSFNIGSGFGSDSSVRSIIIDNTNSKIYVGGQFYTYRGYTQNYFVRLNMNGSRDNTFNIGTGFSATVNAINIDTINQKIYVGGNFHEYNGFSQKGFVRLNTDGSRDNTFNMGTGFGISSHVFAINMDTINQKIYVGGSFSTYNGFSQKGLIRLNTDGSLDTSFNVGTGFNGGVYIINIDTINQKIYVGGNFTTYNGSTQNRIVRLNMNGSKDTSFNVGTGFDTSHEWPDSILVDNEKNKIYIAGTFTKYNNQPQKYIARLNMNGSLDTSFNIQLGSFARTILKYTV